MAKIAIIDDDPDIVEATSLLLESKGHVIVTAGNLEEGMNLIDSEKPELILLDVMMDEPDDGFYMAHKLRKLGIRTPIILLTSVSNAIGYNYGVGETLPIDDFLEKPVLPSVLMEKVKFYTEKKGGKK
ncbi:MAG: response regulator [bacterium]